MMALQGVEMVILGYNTPATNSQYFSESAEQRMFHHRLVLQAAVQQNSTWVVAIAKAGVEDGHALIGGSVIVNPDGIIVAETNSDADELIVHSCNLDDCLFGKQSRFDFCRHRRIEHYGLITEQSGVVKPLECDSLSRSCESESKILSASSGSHDAGMDFLDLSPR